MAYGPDEIDLTPPPMAEDEERFFTWLIENFSRLRTLLEDGFTGEIIDGEYTDTYEYGVLKSRELTEVFSDDFSVDFR